MSSPISPESQPPAKISPFLPAAILERAGIKLCMVGNAAVIHFGSDLVLADLDLAIADEQLDLALSTLRNEGFCNIDFSSCQLGSMPVVGGPGGWVAHRLQHPSSSYKVMLYPASCWHLDINPDTTFLRHPDPYRFPSFLAYLRGNPQSPSLLGNLKSLRMPSTYRYLSWHKSVRKLFELPSTRCCSLHELWLLTAGTRCTALINTIDALVSAGDNPLHIRYLYSIMVVLLGRRPELKGMMSPGDQFFMDFYMKQYARSGKLRVLELRRGIIAGTISVDTARAVVPRPDLSRRRIGERQLRQRMREGNTEGVAGGYRENG